MAMMVVFGVLVAVVVLKLKKEAIGPLTRGRFECMLVCVCLCVNGGPLLKPCVLLLTPV